MHHSRNAKCEEYVEYANRCLAMASTTTDDTSRALLRKMAAEWLELAEAALETRRR